MPVRRPGAAWSARYGVLERVARRFFVGDRRRIVGAVQRREHVAKGGIVRWLRQDLQRSGDGFDNGHDLSPG
jgi:hypothetical protein